MATNKKETIKGRIIYVEPNDFIGETGITLDSKNAIDNAVFNPEDYNIAVDLQVIVPDRDSCGMVDYEAKVVLTNFDSGSFFRGTKLNEKDDDSNYLTDNFTNISYREIGASKTGNAETFGVNSIEINFDSMFFPLVTINFTDVRGSALMEPAECNFAERQRKIQDGTYNATPYKSFFKTLFHFPYPRFALSVKGFYGTRVTFMLSIQDFKSSFNSSTGNFDVTVKFIGNMYGIYSDIPMNYLIVAPYVGSNTQNDVNNYWKTQVENGVFTFKEGGKIPTFIEIIDTFNKISDRFSEIMGNDSLALSEEKYKSVDKLTRLRKELTMLTEVKKEYDSFVNSVRNTLDRNADRSIRLIEKNHFIACFTTQQKIIFDKGMTALQKKFNDYCEAYNFSDDRYNFIFSKSYNTKDSDSGYDEQTIFSVFNKTKSCTFNEIFGDQQGQDGIDTPMGISKDKILKLLDNYNKGSENKAPLRYCIFKKYDAENEFYNKIEKREEEINKEISDILTSNEENNKFKELTREILGFTPNIENIFRIIFAHIDCFMNSFYSTLRQIKASGRKNTDRNLRITDLKGETDINSSSPCFVPPFTAFYKTNISTKMRERMYPTYDLIEKELVNRFLDGISSVEGYGKDLFPKEEKTRESNEYSFRPITIFDIFLKGRNPYYDIQEGNDNDAEDYFSRILIKFCKRLAVLKAIEGGDVNKKIEREAENIYKILNDEDKYNINSVIEYILESDSTESNKYNNCLNIINKAASGDEDFENYFHFFSVNMKNANYGNPTTQATTRSATNLSSSFYEIQRSDLNNIVYGYDEDGNEIKLNDHLGCRKLDFNEEYIDDFLLRVTERRKDWIYTNKNNSTGVRYRWFDENNPTKYEYKGVSPGFYNEYVRKQFNALPSNIRKELEDKELVIPFLKEHNFPFAKNLYFNEDFNGKNGITDATKRGVAFLTALVNTDEIFPKDIFSNTCIAEVPRFIELFAGSQIANNGFSLSNISGEIFDLYNFKQDKYKVKKISGIKFDEVIKVLPDSENNFKKWINTGYSKDSFSQIDQLLSASTKSENIEKYIFNGCSAPIPNAMPEYASKELYDFYMQREIMLNIPDTTVDAYKNLSPTLINLHLSEIISFCKILQKLLKPDVASYNTSERTPEENGTEYVTNITEDRRMELYYTFKGLYDKWLASYTQERFKLNPPNGIRSTSITEFDSFIFTDIYYHNIGETFMVDMGAFYNQLWSQIEGKSNRSVLEFIGDLLQDNKLLFMALPTYNNFHNPESIVDIFRPHSIYNNSSDNLRDLELNKRSFGNTYLVIYTHEPSNKVSDEDEENTNSSGYNNDGLDIADILSKPTSLNDILSQTGNDYIIPAFAVSFAKQNQSFFKSISINMDSPRETDYSIYNTLILANQEKRGDTNSPIPIGQDMFSIFSNRSYDCSVEMMGCANIMPSMYFQLNNIPMFRGAYVITKVEHTIQPGTMTTKFRGTRISANKIPYTTSVIDIESLIKRVTGGKHDTNELPYPEEPRETTPIGEEPKLSGNKSWSDVFVFSVKECLNATLEPQFAHTFLNEMYEKSGESTRAKIMNKRDLYDNGIFNNIGRGNNTYGGIGYCCASVARIVNEGFIRVYENMNNGYTKRLLLTSVAKNAGAVLLRRGFELVATTRDIAKTIRDNQQFPARIPLERGDRQDFMKENCKPGDIAVMAREDNTQAGHIAILLGKNGDINEYWVSDYRQKSSKDCWVYGNETPNFIDIYRYKGKIENI